jgi:hypothetical protein
MRSLNGSIHTTQTPPPLSFYNTFKFRTFVYSATPLKAKSKRIKV